MKKVFIPSRDDLYKMQDRGINILPYLYAKVIESLCISYNNYSRKGSILKNEYKYLREDPVIASAICMMYPNEIMHSTIASYDNDLAINLITTNRSNDIYRLDNLSRFNSLVTSNTLVQKEVIKVLYEELRKNPKYRFEYKDNKLLDDIFMGKFDTTMFFGDKENYDYMLGFIEPYYALNSDYDTLSDSMKYYVNKYGIIYTSDKSDILTEESTEVKRLIKCINKK